jgi:hypothetical protein
MYVCSNVDDSMHPMTPMAANFSAFGRLAQTKLSAADAAIIAVHGDVGGDEEQRRRRP